MRDFNQGGGPVRNSYVTERSVPYTRDYGGKVVFNYLNSFSNLFESPIYSKNFLVIEHNFTGQGRIE
jgi:hypothetical protein